MSKASTPRANDTMFWRQVCDECLKTDTPEKCAEAVGQLGTSRHSPHLFLFRCTHKLAECADLNCRRVTLVLCCTHLARRVAQDAALALVAEDGGCALAAGAWRARACALRARRSDVAARALARRPTTRPCCERPLPHTLDTLPAHAGAAVGRLRESMGISADATTKAFPSTDVDRFMKNVMTQIPVDIFCTISSSNTNHIVVAVDPAGGGSSQFAITSICQLPNGGIMVRRRRCPAPIPPCPPPPPCLARPARASSPAARRARARSGPPPRASTRPALGTSS